MVMTLHAGAMVGLCFSTAPPGGDVYDGTKRVWAHVPGFDTLDTRTLEGGFPGGWFLCHKRDPNAVHQEIFDAGGPPEWMRADAWEWEARKLRARVAELDKEAEDLGFELAEAGTWCDCGG